MSHKLSKDQAAARLGGFFARLKARKNPDAVAFRKHMEEKSDDSPYVPTSHGVVGQFLQLAKLTTDDVLCDVGCGDGRVLVAAARQGVRSIGFDICPVLVARARALAEQEGVAELVEVHVADILSDAARALLRRATVIFLFMLPIANAAIKSILLSECVLQEDPKAIVTATAHKITATTTTDTAIRNTKTTSNTSGTTVHVVATATAGVVTAHGAKEKRHGDGAAIIGRVLPSARVVTNTFQMKGWEAEEVVPHDVAGAITALYLYQLPPRLCEA